MSVDPDQLALAGNELQAAASRLPAAPPPFMPIGFDPLSAEIIAQIPAIETPIATQLPAVQAQATKTAGNVVAAAEAYSSTDQQLGGQISQEMQNLPNEAGPAGAAAEAAGSGAGSMSQMMSMPMQIASQVAQAPTQAMGAVSSVPQGAMQGVQQVGQQVSQLTGQFGQGDSGVESTSAAGTLDAGEPQEDGASAGDSDTERAPVAEDTRDAERPDDEQRPGRHRAESDPAVDL
ncbi:MAG: hypothetical protein SW019_08950 [Actinomycetota bacterium]|nr:hypothetical protein [Actinomycetota bacterium]